MLRAHEGRCHARGGGQLGGAAADASWHGQHAMGSMQLSQVQCRSETLDAWCIQLDVYTSTFHVVVRRLVCVL